MAQGDTQITIVGNLVADPELKYTQNGTEVANLRVASTPKVYRDGQWVDGDGLFLTCNVWREPAENVMESLTKGMRVIVQGRLRQRSYDTNDGQRRTIYEVEVDEIGPSLRFATTTVQRTQRQGNQSGGKFGGDGWGSKPQNTEPPW